LPTATATDSGSLTLAATSAERHERVAEFLARRVESREGGLEILDRRQSLGRRPHRFVAGGRALPALDAGEMPDDPIGGLDEGGAFVVDLAVLEPHLDQLGEVPLR
jgi:hypothetical protein